MVCLDETFYSVRSGDIARTEEGNKLRGLSSNQMCIGVACDKSRTLCIFEDYGKPSQKKTYESFKDHIAVGSTLIHDKENGFLYAHTSFNRDKIQGYLNLFTFVMNPPENHLEKVEILLDLAFQNPKTLRYREFYGVKQ